MNLIAAPSQPTLPVELPRSPYAGGDLVATVVGVPDHTLDSSDRNDMSEMGKRVFRTPEPSQSEQTTWLLRGTLDDAIQDARRLHDQYSISAMALMQAKDGFWAVQLDECSTYTDEFNTGFDGLRMPLRPKLGGQGAGFESATWRSEHPDLRALVDDKDAIRFDRTGDSVTLTRADR